MKRIWEWLKLHPMAMGRTKEGEKKETLELKFKSDKAKYEFINWLSSESKKSPYEEYKKKSP